MDTERDPDPESVSAFFLSFLLGSFADFRDSLLEPLLSRGLGLSFLLSLFFDFFFSDLDREEDLERFRDCDPLALGVGVFARFFFSFSTLFFFLWRSTDSDRSREPSESELCLRAWRFFFSFSWRLLNEPE